MSKTKRRLKAQKRMAEYRKHGLGVSNVCRNCGTKGSHFVPPCFGDSGFYMCSKKEGE